VLFEPDTPWQRRYREIEAHYHLALIAEDQRELARHYLDVERGRSQQAEAFLGHQKKSNDLLGDIARNATGVARGLDEVAVRLGVIETSVERLNDTAMATLGAIGDLSVAIQREIEGLATLALQQRKVLDEISDTLRHPYETQAAELRERAQVWIKNGMRRTGEHRRKAFDDAMHLLKETAQNHIGNLDGVVWFQIAWLQWKHLGNLPEAEAAFDRAAHLNEPQLDEYYEQSLRHLAYLQYLQDKFEEAHSTIRRVLEVRIRYFEENVRKNPESEACKEMWALADLHRHDYPDYESGYDAAIYAATVGDERELERLLSWCIRTRSSTLISMFSEPAFQAFPDLLIDTHATFMREAQSQAVAKSHNWEAAISKVELVARESQVPLPLPSLFLEDTKEWIDRIPGADYCELGEIRNRLTAAADDVMPIAADIAIERVARCQREVQVQRGRCDAVEHELISRKREAESHRRSMVAAANDRLKAVTKPNAIQEMLGSKLYYLLGVRDPTPQAEAERNAAITAVDAAYNRSITEYEQKLDPHLQQLRELEETVENVERVVGWLHKLSPQISNNGGSESDVINQHRRRPVCVPEFSEWRKTNGYDQPVEFSRWLVTVGQTVSKGQPLFELKFCGSRRQSQTTTYHSNEDGIVEGLLYEEGLHVVPDNCLTWLRPVGAQAA
jgi:tetratricopeptide (TPR) repeat protein